MVSAAATNSPACAMKTPAKASAPPAGKTTWIGTLESASPIRRQQKLWPTSLTGSAYRNFPRVPTRLAGCAEFFQEKRWTTRQARVRKSLFSQIKQGQQEQPKGVHEVPVVRSHFRRHGAGHLCLIKIARGYEGQRGNSSKQMQRVRPGKNVEEAAGGIAGEINSFGDQLPPGHDLPNQKSNAKDRGDQPQIPVN